MDNRSKTQNKEKYTIKTGDIKEKTKATTIKRKNRR